MSEQQIEQRTCRFPGCARPAVAAEGAGAGRPPEYCADPGHNRAAAWRARRRLGPDQPTRTVEEEKRPFDAARQRASEIRAQVAGIAEHLGQQMIALVEELRTVADPEAAEAQIETVTSEAAEQVASASARASRAERAQRQAEVERAEADAAAEESTELAARQEAEMLTLRQDLTERGEAFDQVKRDLDAERTAAEIRDAELVDARAQIGDLETGLGEAERNRETAIAQDRAARTALAAAEERARGAVAQAETEAGRATRAEKATAEARTQVSTLSEHLAVANAAIAASVADVARERAVGDQRVTDLRDSYESQVSALRADLTDVKKEERTQRTRADRLESKLEATTTKTAK